MTQLRRRNRSWPAEVMEAIEERASLGEKGVAIRRFLEREFPPNDVPSLRTIQNIMGKAAGLDELWSSLDASARDVAAVVPVQAARAARAGGARPISRALAEQVVRVSQFAPGAPPNMVLALAQAYAARHEAGDATLDLDVFVGFAPWRPEGATRYAALVALGHTAAAPLVVLREVEEFEPHGAVTLAERVRVVGGRTLQRFEPVPPDIATALLTGVARQKGNPTHE